MTKHSPIWAFFMDEGENAICFICEQPVPKKDSNTKGMESHLRIHHQPQFAQYEQFKKEQSLDNEMFHDLVRGSIEKGKELAKKDKELAKKDKDLASLRKELGKTKAQLDLYKKHDASVPSAAEFVWCTGENPVLYSDVVRMDERKNELMPNPDSESNQIDNFDESEVIDKFLSNQFFAQIDTLSNQEHVSEQPSTSAGAVSKEAEPKTDANE